MKKFYFLFITLLITSLSFGQGTETFDNFSETGSSYADGTFTGQDGSTWNYVQSRGDQSINGKSLMLGRGRTPQSEVYSGTISGGIGTISFSYQQAFSTPVNLNILINDIVYGTVTSSDQTVQNSGTITVNQPGDVVIKLINVNNSDGQVTIDDITWTGYTGSATPTLSVTSPSDNSIYPSGTSSVNIEFLTANTNSGEQVNITINGGTTNTNVSSPFPVNTSDGESYSVLVELVDSGANILQSETINFDVLFPCTLEVGTIETICDTNTAGTDTYTTTIEFTGGASSQYTIDTGGVGTVEGDDPTSVTSGTITITGVNEGTDFTVTFNGNPTDSSCDFTRNISSPSCISSVCANPGDIIITEIMQNPSIVNDGDGEYFEVYNTTGNSINLIGWTISDAGSDSHTITSDLIVAPMDYAILGINSNTGTNGGVTVDYQYADFNLANGDDEIIISCTSTVIDEVAYDGGPNFPDPNGASMELSTAALNSTDNDSSSNWGAATSTFGSGDLGTPGVVNDFTLSNKTFDIAGFNMYPNPTSLGYVNITAKSTSKMDITVFDLLGKQVIKQSVSHTLDVSGLKAGVYIMKVTQDDAVSTRKLVIK